MQRFLLHLADLYSWSNYSSIANMQIKTFLILLNSIHCEFGPIELQRRIMYWFSGRNYASLCFVWFTPGLLTALFNGGDPIPMPAEIGFSLRRGRGELLTCLWVVQTHRGPPLF